MSELPKATFAERQAHRGYHIPYRSGMDCPGCGNSHWFIGGVYAECAFCATALPLLQSIRRGGIIFSTRSRTA